MRLNERCRCGRFKPRGSKVCVRCEEAEAWTSRGVTALKKALDSYPGLTVERSSLAEIRQRIREQTPLASNAMLGYPRAGPIASDVQQGMINRYALSGRRSVLARLAAFFYRCWRGWRDE